MAWEDNRDEDMRRNAAFPTTDGGKDSVDYGLGDWERALVGLGVRQKGM